MNQDGADKTPTLKSARSDNLFEGGANESENGTKKGTNEKPPGTPFKSVKFENEKNPKALGAEGDKNGLGSAAGLKDEDEV